MTKRAARKPRGFVYFIGLGLSVGLFAFVALIGLLAIAVPAATGSIPMTVLTGSMSPTYPPGTLIIVKPIDEGDVRIGDVLTYQIESGKPAVVTHRVVSVTTMSNGGHSFETKGDANNAVDQKQVIPEQIRGKVWYALPFLGFVNSAVNGEARGWLIPLIAVGLFAYVGYLAASGTVSKLRKRQKRLDRSSDIMDPAEADAQPAPEKRERGRRSAARN